MYYEHFGLSGSPFEFNPSASVLFMSAGHREGLAALEWGLREPSGFTMLVGEIGTGKTTLIYSLLANRHEGVRTAWVANPRISFEEMLRQILGQLGVEQPVNSGRLALLQALDAQLATLGEQECIAIIIDEAQDLSDEALEDIRLLSNFQSLERRRLQIVLVGQIDLAKRLSRPQLRQLNQRIGARALLPTLKDREIYDYVEYRVRSRGGDIEGLFTRAAIREVMRTSAGIPRRINVLCHNAMFMAYADGERCVSDRHVKDAGRDYDHLLVIRPSERVAASASAVIQSASAAMRSATWTMRGAGSEDLATPEIPEIPQIRAHATRPVRAMAVSLFAMLCLAGIAAAGIVELKLARHDLPAMVERFSSQAARLKALIVVEREASQVPSGSEQDKISSVPTENESRSKRTTRFSRTGHSSRKKRQPDPGDESNVVPMNLDPPETTTPVDGNNSNNSAAPQDNSAAPKKEDGATARTDTTTLDTTTVLVKAGDSLSKIALRLYGSLGSDGLNRLTAANPQIKNVNVIYPGQTIHVLQAAK